jgi:hypothetical protein
MYPSPDTLLSEQRLSLFDRGARGAVPTLKAHRLPKSVAYVSAEGRTVKASVRKTRVFAGLGEAGQERI